MGFITGGPTEAIVVSGCFHSKPLIVVRYVPGQCGCRCYFLCRAPLCFGCDSDHNQPVPFFYHKSMEKAVGRVYLQFLLFFYFF